MHALVSGIVFVVKCKNILASLYITWKGSRLTSAQSSITGLYSVRCSPLLFLTLAYILQFAVVYQLYITARSTEAQSYFMQIIGHNSVIFIGFPPNVVWRFALMSPLSVPNFSLNGVCVCILWQILQSVRKEVVVEEEKTPNFGY